MITRTALCYVVFVPEANVDQPLTFQPIFMERVWGGRRLESLYGKRLPAAVAIGESWEIVDRPEAQSVVRAGRYRGLTLHELWTKHRQEIFGVVPDAPRFPILAKLLDARESLSVQVHPAAGAPATPGAEPKTEFWYVLEASPAAELYVGLKAESSRTAFEQAIADGNTDQHLHRIPVQTDDAMFLPSGRIHALGAGNVIVEIQQNSDTTYRVFDWNRRDASGAARALHVAESLESIDFADRTPALVKADGEELLRDSLFHIDKWTLDAPRTGAAPGQFAIIFCIRGGLECAGETIQPGGFMLLPASLDNRELRPIEPSTTLLRITVPPTA